MNKHFVQKLCDHPLVDYLSESPAGHESPLRSPPTSPTDQQRQLSQIRKSQPTRSASIGERIIIIKIILL
jgi:hypothetical protein